MNGTKQFTSRIGALAAAASVVALSAFAEYRHPQTTETRENAPTPSSITDRYDSTEQANQGTIDRERPRGQEEREADERRPSPKHGGTWGNGDDRFTTSQGDRTPYHANGRVTAVRPWGNGYRVWVGGTSYPFYVPAAYWNANDFQIGVAVNLGGYYNPAGYYDYYSDHGYNGYGNERLRGVVTQIDFRRGIVELRTRGGRLVEVILPERFERIRPGDYVAAYGDWSRRGFFVADDVDVIDDYRR